MSETQVICARCGLHLGGPVAGRYVRWSECPSGTGCRHIPLVQVGWALMEDALRDIASVRAPDDDDPLVYFQHGYMRGRAQGVLDALTPESEEPRGDDEA